MRNWILILFFGILGQASTPEPVRVLVYADGELHRGVPAGGAPADALGSAGITLDPGDLLMQDGLTLAPDMPWSPAGDAVLQVVRAQDLEWDGGRITTAAPTVAAALWEAGIVLRQGDIVDPAPQTPLAADLEVRLVQARPVTALVGGEEITTWTPAETVGEALLNGGLGLQGLDYSLPPPDAPVPAGGEIRVVKVEEEIILEQVTIPFETLTQPAADLEIDTQQVVQVGAFGLQASRVRVRYEDGVEVERVTEAQWTAAEPQPRIIGYGTNIVVRTLGTPGGPIEYWRAVPAYATSYSPCRLGTDSCGNTTASGLQLEKGMVAVIRSWYNAMVFSQVYVEGYGVGTIADIGAGVSGQHWIDLGYSDEDWVSWSGTVTVYFLTPVPAPDQVLWILP